MYWYEPQTDLLCIYTIKNVPPSISLLSLQLRGHTCCRLKKSTDCSSHDFAQGVCLSTWRKSLRKQKFSLKYILFKSPINIVLVYCFLELIKIWVQEEHFRIKCRFQNLKNHNKSLKSFIMLNCLTCLLGR